MIMALKNRSALWWVLGKYNRDEKNKLFYILYPCLSYIYWHTYAWPRVIPQICGQGRIAGTVIYSDLIAIAAGKRFLNDPLAILRHCGHHVGIVIYQDFIEHDSGHDR